MEQSYFQQLRTQFCIFMEILSLMLVKDNTWKILLVTLFWQELFLLWQELSSFYLTSRDMGVSPGFRRSFTATLPDPSSDCWVSLQSQPVGARGTWSTGWCCSEFQGKFMKTQLITYCTNLFFWEMVGYSWYSLRHYGIHHEDHIIWGSTTILAILTSPSYSLFEITLVFFVTTFNFFPGCFERIMLPSMKAVEFIQSPSFRAGSTYLWTSVGDKYKLEQKDWAGLGAGAPWLPGRSGP